jgi:predicted ATPase/DNA-binding SARP family transcriptional activator
MRVRDLGLLTVEVDGVEQPLRGRRPQVILARLLVSVNQRVTAAEIVEAVWGDDIADHTSTLESHIWRLRQVLEPYRPPRQPPQVLLTDVEGYRLVARVEEVDSLRFERDAGEIRELVATSDADRVLRRCDEALALSRGTPFEPASEELWAATAVARIQQMHIEVATIRIDALLELGQHQQALADLEGLVAATPLQERFWAQRMLALHRAGRTDQALEAYRRVRALLDEELGLQPGVELDQLHRRILDQDPDLVARRDRAPERADALAPRTSVPPRTTSLVGRSGDVARIARLVTSHRLVTLTGVGGCGKTRLAVEVAHSLTVDFPDGVCFVDLASAEDETMVAEFVASTLRLAPGIVGSALESTVDYLQRRRMLLVLDNCEHVLPGAAALVEMLVRADAQCAVLLTSREAVMFPGEVIWTLGPLALETESAARPAPAVELFLARLAESVPDLQVDASVRAQAEELCAAVDGLPLAIELAAARVRTDGIAAVLAQAATDPSRLRRLRSSPGAHHDSVGEAIEWSYRALADDERILHRRLSVVPGSFTAGVAVALASPSDAAMPTVDAEAITDVLSSLVHRSLLVPIAASTPSGRPRFRQLATVRAHARRALRREDEFSGTEDARDAWAKFLIGDRPRLFDLDAAGWHDAVDDDFDAIRGSLHRLLVAEPQAAGATLVTGMGGYWYLRRRMVEGLSWLQLAQTVPGVDPLDAAEVQCALAVRFVLQGRSDLALPHIRIALEWGTSSPDAARSVELSWALAGLAFALLTGSEGELAAAVIVGVRRAAEASEDADLALVAEALSAVVATPPDPGAVDAIYERATRTRNSFAASVCASFFSLFALMTGDPLLGRAWVERGRELHARVGGRAFSGYDENRANFAAMAGEYTTAARLYGASSSAAFHDGTIWPRQAVTQQLLRRTQDALTREEFLSAWRAGEQPDGA